MFGRGSAAAADDPDPVLDEPARVRSHVLGRAEINISTFDVARLAGIRLRRQPRGRDLSNPLDRVEHGSRTDGAVHADERGPAPRQLRGESLWRRPVERAAVFLRAHLRDDRQVRDAADSLDGGADFVQIAEGLEHDELHPTVDQRLRLFAEKRARFVDARLAPGLNPDAERTDGAGHVGAVAGSLARDARALLVDLLQPLGYAERGELDPVGAEGVRLDDVGAGPDVLLMHAGNEVRLRDVQRVEALVDEYTLRVEHRPHRAVAHEHAFVNRFEKLLHRYPFTRSPDHQIHVSSRSHRNVSASMSRYDLVTTSSPIERTPCRIESVNS